MSPGNGRRPRPAAGPTSTTNLTPTTDAATSVRRVADKTLPIAGGSAYRPVGGRRLWAFSVRCGTCSYVHLHRAESVEDIDGQVRTGNCGTSYVVRVRRTYPAAGDAA